MKVRLHLGGRSDPDAALMRLAGWSALAHVAGLVIFSLAPRFMTPPPPRPTLVGELVPVSSLLPSPRPGPPAPAGPSASERAKEARQAQKEREDQARRPEPKPPDPPKPKKDPTVPPLEARKDRKEKPERKEPPRPAEPEVPPPTAPADPGDSPEPSDAPASTTDAVAPGTPAGAGGLSFDTTGLEPGGGVPSIGSSSFPYDYYRSSLMTLLQSNWRRPVAPGGLAEPLRCAVGFTILKTGLVKDPQIVVPSGNTGLDRSALRAVIDSSPLPPLPFQYGHGAVGAVVYFELTSD